MDIEQLPPNKPNFLLILILFGVAILVIFVVAYFFVDFDGKHLTFRHHSSHPTSQLIVPAPPATSQLAQPLLALLGSECPIHDSSMS